jgi:thiosulfate/3-mercaptopyruvate sulfurtransferase
VQPLISVDELAGLLVGGHPPVLLDVRWRLTGPPAEPDYRAGHIPHAVFVDLDADLADPPGERGRHPLSDPDRLQDTLRRWGIRDESPVVAYDDGDATSAARAWWVLRWAGIEDVRVLDGGWRAWIDAAGVVTTTVPRPSPGDVVVRPGALPALDASAAAALGRDGVLLDAREAERYRGDVEPVDPVAGHIPGAVSAPTSLNVDAQGRFRSPEALRERFAALGVRHHEPVGVYCGSGVTAAHEVLALALAGLDAALYPGSWSEWVTDPERPVATGQ